MKVFIYKVLCFLEKCYQSMLKLSGVDGLLHIESIALIVALVGTFTNCWVWGAVAGIAFGILKEVFDYFLPETHSVEVKDLICDAGGIGLGVLICVL